MRIDPATFQEQHINLLSHSPHVNDVFVDFFLVSVGKKVHHSLIHLLFIHSFHISNFDSTSLFVFNIPDFILPIKHSGYHTVGSTL